MFQEATSDPNLASLFAFGLSRHAATDIFDKELNDLRKARWQKAFAANGTGSEIEMAQSSKHQNDSGLRATIVIEHIIQASGM